MRSLATTSSVPQRSERLEQKSLQFRSLALLYPGKEVLERIRRHGDDNAPLPRYISPIFDEDSDRCSPLDENEDIRIVIAQDDTGVSLSRLLFDSHENKPPPSAASSQTPKILAFSRASSPADASRSSAFIRPQALKETRNRVPSTQTKAYLNSPSPSPSPSQSTFFGQSSHKRRLPAYVSLADARNDPSVPIENTKEEMDSWLDCVFGRGQMRYRGNNTKLHVLQRQPIDPRLAHWEGEAQRGGFELCPQRNAPLPTLKPAELVKLRKPTLLISRTFTVPVQNENLPDKLRHKIAVDPYLTDNKADSNRTKALPKVHCNTPSFAVAIILPLKKLHHGEDIGGDPLQLVIDNWHIITRALDALEASASAHIQRQLHLELEAMARSSVKALPASSRHIRLITNALQQSQPMIDISESVSARITRAFHILNVSSRGEWNIWRDELRDSSRSEKGADFARINFTQLALTAALSSNLSWMRVFAPPQLQIRLQREARVLGDDYAEAQNRIVVTTTDHNRARQMIYILSKFMPVAQPSEQFTRSPTSTKTSARVSALTQGLKAVAQQPATLKIEGQKPRGPTISIGAPSFSLPSPSSPETSSVKYMMRMSAPQSRSPSKSSLQRTKSRIDVQAKGTPAMPIASAPGSSWTTPAVSPDARPSSSASAQSNLMRQLQRNNSALSETSTESGSFWNSLRSNSWNWGIRRESGATSASESAVGISASQRGDIPTGILKTGKPSYSRNTGKKLVRMVEEAEQLHMQQSAEDSRKDSGITTLTTLHPTSESAPAAFTPMLEYTYDSVTSVVDVRQLGVTPDVKSCKVPVRSDQFPRTSTEDFSTSDVLSSCSASNITYDRVAGYLDRLHPDFALQAVVPSRHLEDDLKKYMQGERSPKHGFVASEPQSFPVERWSDVCSTTLIDADTMTVKRLTLRRRVQYSLTTPDGMPDAHVPRMGTNAIKVIKSEEMDSVQRTYKRNDTGHKVAWKDKKVVPSGSESSGSGGETPLTSGNEQVPVGSTGTVFKRSMLPESVEPRSLAVGSTDTAHKQPISTSGPVVSRTKNTTVSIDTAKTNSSPKKLGNSRPAIGDDLTAFIDANAKAAKAHDKPKAQVPVTNARRAPLRNREGKITGWKELGENETEEPGLHDLPASFVNPKRETLVPVIHERTLEEVFVEEHVTKPDPAITGLLEQMLISSDSRSTVPSRAGSVHERTRSRSNSICGSGLAELQHESKKIVEEVLQDLVTSVASDRQSPSRPSAGFFGFRRGGSVLSDASVLRQSISKWLAEG